MLGSGAPGQNTTANVWANRRRSETVPRIASPDRPISATIGSRDVRSSTAQTLAPTELACDSRKHASIAVDDRVFRMKIARRHRPRGSTAGRHAGHRRLIALPHHKGGPGPLPGLLLTPNLAAGPHSVRQIAPASSSHQRAAAMPLCRAGLSLAPPAGGIPQLPYGTYQHRFLPLR